MTKKKEISTIADALEALKAVPLGERSKEALRKVDDEAHENPWLFVGVAALLAALVGFMLGRRSKD